MLIDNALQQFTEKYDRAAIQSIDNIANDLGLKHNQSTIQVFNIKESFDKFQSFIKGYTQYRKVYKESAEASSTETIQNDFNNALPKFFESKDIRYAELPNFVHDYVSGVKSLLETVDSVKTDLMENDIQLEYVAAVNDFTDTFFQKLQESFESSMDRILWASGYNASKRIAERVNNSISSKPVFL